MNRREALRVTLVPRRSQRLRQLLYLGKPQDRTGSPFGQVGIGNAPMPYAPCPQNPTPTRSGMSLNFINKSKQCTKPLSNMHSKNTMRLP